MSGTTVRNTTIRIGLSDPQNVRARLEAIGVEGKKSLDKLDGAAAQQGLLGLSRASDSLVQSMGRLGVPIGRVQGILGTLATGIGGSTLALGALGGAAAAAGVAIARAGDQYTQTMSRLQAATGSLSAAQDVYQQLYQLSQQTGVAVSESAGAFVRFSVAAKNIGATNDQVLALVKTIQQAGIVSGAATEEIKAGTMQLGQALASGVLQGDELRSILENMPTLANQLAEQLGVGIGQLRAMGAAGQLTADTVMPALIRAGEQINEQFDKMPPTMARSFDILGSAMGNFVASLDKSLGLSRLIADAVKGAAAVVNGARATVAPTDQESAAAVVAAAQKRLLELQEKAAQASDLAAGYVGKGYTQRQADEMARKTLSFGGQYTTPSPDVLAKAFQDLQQALAQQRAIKQAAYDQQANDQADALNKQFEQERAAALKSIQALKEGNDKRIGIEADYKAAVEKINKALAAGVIDQQEANAGLTEALKKRDDALKALVKTTHTATDQRQKVIDGLAAQLAAAQGATTGTKAGTEAAHRMALALEIEQKQRAAGIPVVEKRTAADKAAAATIADYVTKLDALKTASAAAEKAANAQAAQQRKLDEQATRTTDNIVRYAGDKFADLFTSTGRGWAGLMDSLKDTAIATFARIAAEALIRPIVMPIVASLVGTTGGIAGIGGIAGAASGSGGSGGITGGLGHLLGLSNLGSQLGLPSIGNALGLTGSGGLLTGLLSTAIIPGATASTTAALAGMGGAFGPATLAQFNAAGGAGLFGASGATLGGLLGGAGLGFGAGTLLNGLLGGHQLGGSIGSGVGGLAGAAIGSIIPGVGTILGGLIGGALGGAGGGLFGPRKTDATAVGTYDLLTGAITQSNGPKETQETQGGRAKALAAMQQATQTLVALTGQTIDAQVRLHVGQRDGTKLFFTQGGVETRQQTGVGDIDGIVKLFKQDLIGAVKDASGDIKLVLDAAGRDYDRAIAGLGFLNATYKGLTDTTTALNAYDAAVKALTDTYKAATTEAEKYGLSVQKLKDVEAEKLAKLAAARDQQAQSITDALHIRLLGDSGDAKGAALASFDLQAAAQENQLRDQIEALGLSGTQYAADRIIEIEKALAQERLAIEKQYAAQSKQASQGLLTQLAFGAGSALSPEQQYFAALSVLNTARHDLDAGGNLSAYASAAQQVLPVARDYLGTSQRYAALVADIAGTVSGAGGDPAGLGALLTAQVDSTDNLAGVYATIANKQLDTANATLAELKRLASTLEALIARQTAA
jgi:tape measure domain-containing protein